MDTQSLQMVITFIQAVGFPIFVASVLLFRVDKMHAENLKAINALTDAVWAMTGRRPSSSFDGNHFTDPRFAAAGQTGSK